MENFVAIFWSAVLLACALFLIARVCQKNVALRTSRFLLSAIVMFWCVAILVKKYYLDQIFPPIDGVIHEDFARLIAGHLRNLNFSSAMSYFGAGNSGYRFLLGIFYAITNAPEVVTYALNGFFAFWGSLILLGILCRHTHCKRMPYWVVAMTCLTPSLLFWTMGNAKEGLVYWGICAMLQFTLHNRESRIRQSLLLPVLGATISGFFRPHIAIAYLIAIGVGAVLRQKRVGFGVVIVFGVMAAFIGLRTLRPDLVQNFTDEGMIKTLGNQYVQVSALGGSAIQFRNGTPTPVVSGLLLILFRPYPTEVYDIRLVFAGLEVWVISAVITWSWLKSRQRSRLLTASFTLTTLIAILLLSLFFSYMYNMGLMIRQRVMIFPLLFTLAALPALVANCKTKSYSMNLKKHRQRPASRGRQRTMTPA